MVIRRRYSSFFLTSTPSSLSGGGEGVVWSVVADNTGLVALDGLSDAGLVLLLPLLLAELSSLRLRKASSLVRCVSSQHHHFAGVRPNQRHRTISLPL